MKKVLSLFLSVSILFISCNDSKGKKKETVAGDNKEVTDKKDNQVKDDGYFTITAPAGWEKSDTSYQGQHVVFIRLPRQNENDDFMENVNVVTEKVGDYNIDDYVDKNISYMESGLTDFVKGKITSRKMGPNDFKMLEYSHNYSGVPIDADVYFMIKDGRSYVITCSAKGGTKEQFEPKFDEIVSSFRVN